MTERYLGMPGDKIIYTRANACDDDYETELIVELVVILDSAHANVVIGKRMGKPIVRRVKTKNLRAMQQYQDKIL